MYLKIRTLLLTFLAVAATHICSAQAAPTEQQIKTALRKLPPAAQPLVILKSDKRTLQLLPDKNETFDFDAIDTRFIRSLTVLKGEDATANYGEAGSNGVLIVQLIDDFTFPKSGLLKVKLKD